MSELEKSIWRFGKKQGLIVFASEVLEADVREIQHYHLRFMKDGKAWFDVFPTSLRGFDIGTKKWYSHDNYKELEQRLIKHFNG